MKKYIEFLRKLNNCLEKIGIEINNNFIQEIENVELLVPIIGSFSAGKSTLINSFLQENRLPTNLTPETALATEIRYSNENYIEAVKENGVDTYKIDEIEKIKENAKDYKYLKYFINNQKLKEIEPLILVDMPGFNAPFKLHNQAIMNYLDKGVYFIVVMSVEEGSINKKLFQDIEFISQFRDFSFCLSKVNLKPLNEIENIKEYVKEQLEDLGYFKDIFLLEDKGLDEVIKNIEVDEIYKKLFLDKVEDLYFKVESEINTKISTLKFSKEDALKVIKSLNENIEKIKLQKEESINNVKNRFLNIDINKIIEKVAQEIEINKEYLINKVIKKQDIEEDLNYIIRNVLSKEITKFFENLTQNIVNDFRVSISLEFSGFDIDKEWLDKVSQSVEVFVRNSLKGLEVLGDKLKKSKNWYRSIASIIAIITNVLNPIVEVVLVFLPDILESVLRGYQEQKTKEKLLNEFNTQIIPQIRLKLKSELPVILEKEVTNLIEAISQKFEEELQDKKVEIENSLKEKEENLEKIDEELRFLEEKRDYIRSVANEFFKGVK